MSALGTPVLINQKNAYWLSSIANDVTHSTITTQEIDANLARFSTVYVSDFLTTSTLNASTFKLNYLDLSEANVSTLKTNNIFTSSQTWASDLSGGVGYVRISTDASGVQVDGDPIRFDNLVYFTSTITIVPVSTIVDTDIFSQNGYFSTLSSGSISTGRLQASQASMSTLTVSSIVTTDISGFSPTTWSLYPTLNSSITFNASNVLSNVGNKLFFAGTELTDLSGGGQDWSSFPATTDVSMNNFSLRQVSTLQYNDGAKLYSQTGNNLFYNGQQISYGSQGNNANWAGFPASTNVNMAGFGIGTTGNLPIVAASNITINSGQVSTVVDQGLNIATTANFDVTVQNGNRGIINLTANGGNNNGLFGTINLTANGTSLGGVGSGGLININANTPSGFCNATSAIKMNAAGINSYAGVIPSIGSLAGYNFIYGSAGVNIASGLPSAFPNIPLTTYLYGTAGVTTSSDFYVPNIYPYWNGLTTPPDLMISGRYIIPNLAQVYVQLSNVKSINMQGTALIQDVNIINMSNSGGAITNLSSINGQSITAFANPSNIVCSNLTATISVNTQLVNTQSTVTTSLVNNYAQVSSFFMGNGLILSTTIGDLRANNIKIADDITGVTNAPMPLQSRLLNFSTVNSFNVSTTDLWVSSINGQPIDVSGQPFVNTSQFSTLGTSSFTFSTMNTVLSNAQYNIPLRIDYDAAGNYSTGGVAVQINGHSFQNGAAQHMLEMGWRASDAANYITAVWAGQNLEDLVIEGEPVTITDGILSTVFNSQPYALQTNGAVAFGTTGQRTIIGSGVVSTPVLSVSSIIIPLGQQAITVQNPVRFATQGTIENIFQLNVDQALDVTINANNLNTSAFNTTMTSLSTQNIATSNIKVSTIVASPAYTGEIVFDGQLRPLNNIIVLYNNNIIFQDSTGASQFMTAQQLISQEMPCIINPAGAFGCNLGQIAANQFLIGSGTGAFGAAKLYCDFPGDNWGVDIIDANGATLFETINCYYDPGGSAFQTNLYGVSSIVGFTPNNPPGSLTTVGIGGILTAPVVSTPSLLVSTINGGTLNTINISTLFFSTAITEGTNASSNYPLIVSYDCANNTSTGQVALMVAGTNLTSNSNISQLEFGVRYGSQNFIKSYLPNLPPNNTAELFCDAQDFRVFDGNFSTIINLDPFGLQTSGGIQGPFMSTLDLNVSSINNLDANKAYTNNIQLSTMELYAASTTLMYWDSVTTDLNINTSGYDTVVGLNGTFKIGASFQFLSPGAADEVEFFFLKNDVVIPNAGGICEVANNSEIIQYFETVETLVNGDKIQLGCYTANSNVYVSTVQGTIVQSPAVILTMYKVD